MQSTFPLREIEISIQNGSIKLRVLDNSGGILENCDQDSLPYFADLWPTGVGMSLLLSSGCVDFKNKIILDVGSGTGIVAIVAAKMGGQVYATDYLESCIDLIRQNVALNQLQDQVQILQLDWNEPHLWPTKVDYIVASDILYESFHIKPIAKLFHTILSNGGTAILCDPDRSQLANSFRKELEEMGENVFIHNKKQFPCIDNTSSCKFIEISQSSIQESSPYFKYLMSENSVFSEYKEEAEVSVDIPPPPFVNKQP